MRKLAHIVCYILILLVVIKYANSCQKEPNLILTGCNISSNMVSQTDRNADGSYVISYIRPTFDDAVITYTIEDITIQADILNKSYADAGYFYLMAEVDYEDGTFNAFQQLEYGIPGGQKSYKEMILVNIAYKKVKCIKFSLSY